MNDNTDTETLATALGMLSQEVFESGNRGDADVLARASLRLHDQAEEIERLKTEAEASLAYADANPLGGPAKVFEAAASRIRAGEDLADVMDDYGLAWTDDDIPPDEHHGAIGDRVSMNNSIVNIIERLRLLEHDHSPDGWPAVQMCDITACLDEIERLRAGAKVTPYCGVSSARRNNARVPTK